MYDPDSDWSKWTNEYAAIYIIGPMLGAFMSGHIFNQQKKHMRRMTKADDELTESSDEFGDIAPYAESSD